MTRKPHPDWEPFCPQCVMKTVCDEWEAHPMECGEPMPKWVKQSLNVKDSMATAKALNNNKQK